MVWRAMLWYCALFCCGIVYEILELKRTTLHDTLLEKQPCYKVVASRLIAFNEKGGGANEYV